MPKTDALQTAVDQNFEAFQKLLPKLMQTQSGKYALMRDGQAVEFFDSARDAVIYGDKEFVDGLFSVQRVTRKIIDLGYFSYAMHHDSV